MSIYGDGHVHLHPGSDLSAFFAAALREAGRLRAPFLLLLVEIEGVKRFDRLARAAAEKEPAEGAPAATAPSTEPPSADLPLDIRLQRTREMHSLSFARRGEPEVGFLISGRQLVSSEGIEVLAVGLGSNTAAWKLRDGGHPARELIARVREAGAAAVLPWGLGKWWGARGARVAELATDPALRADPLFLLGDTAHRFRPWPTPRPHRLGLQVLPGTDPLPVRGAEERVGSYGFRVAGALDPERPAGSLLDALQAGRQVEPVGRRASLPSVLVDQVRYRLRSSPRSAGRPTHGG